MTLAEAFNGLIDKVVSFFRLHLFSLLYRSSQIFRIFLGLIGFFRLKSVSSSWAAGLLPLAYGMRTV